MGLNEWTKKRAKNGFLDIVFLYDGIFCRHGAA